MSSFLKILFLLVLISLWSVKCKSKYKVHTETSMSFFKPPRIIDTLPQTNDLRKSSAINISYPSIETVSLFADTCFLNKATYKIWDTSINRDIEQRADGLQFFVDTTQDVTIKYDIRNDIFIPEDTTQVYCKGKPCFIYNETSQVKWLFTQDERIIAIQEAKDSNYQWQPIQIWSWSWCGNSYYRAFIKPSHYLLFKVPLYAGNFYTDIRVKLYSRDVIYYSNQYKGFINYKQFDLPKELMDKDGKPSFNMDFLSN